MNSAYLSLSAAVCIGFLLLTSAFASTSHLGSPLRRDLEVNQEAGRISIGSALLSGAGGSPLDGDTGTSGTDCGTVQELGPNPPADPAALQVESCFLAAFQACQPATLTVASRGVDVGNTTTYAIAPDAGGSCHVEGMTVTVFVPRGPRTITFSCAGVIAQDGGLLIQSCGQYGDIAIPPPTSDGAPGD
jgi:hypothetical protein